MNFNFIRNMLIENYGNLSTTTKGMHLEAIKRDKLGGLYEIVSLNKKIKNQKKLEEEKNNNILPSDLNL